MEREYFVDISKRGEIIHEGVVLDDENFLENFYVGIQENSTGKYSDYSFVSICGREKTFVRAEDTCKVYSRYEGKRLYYTKTLFDEIEFSNFSFSESGILYYTNNNQLGRVGSTLISQLSEHIEPWGAWFSICDEATLRRYVIPPIHIPNHLKLIRPRVGNLCAACGEDNVDSLYMWFLHDTTVNKILSFYKAPFELMGSLNIMHGGYVSLLLDEVMGKAISILGIKAPTAQLNVRFHAPTPLNIELLLQSSIVRKEGRKIFVKGEIRLNNETKKLCASAEALFIELKQ